MTHHYPLLSCALPAQGILHWSGEPSKVASEVPSQAEILSGAMKTKGQLFSWTNLSIMSYSSFGEHLGLARGFWWEYSRKRALECD